MRRIALGLALAIGLATAATAEDKFTAADVLGWAQASQDSFFEASVSMAAVLASQDKNPAAACINDWYFKDRSAIRTANNEIREVMREYSEHYPGIVIVAVIERECGDLTPED